MYPTNLPILDVMLSGSSSASMWSANACAATFSLVKIIMFKLDSKTSSPTTKMAADLVLPAPNTPLMGRSVRPSNSASTSAPIAEEHVHLGCTIGDALSPIMLPQPHYANCSFHTPLQISKVSLPQKRGAPCCWEPAEHEGGCIEDHTLPSASQSAC